MSALKDHLTPDEQRVLDLIEQAARTFHNMDDAIKLEHRRLFEQAIENVKAVLVARVITRLYPEGLL